MRSGNPVLRSDSFSGLDTSTDVMTIQGTVNKTFLLLVVLVLAATWTWNRYFSGGGFAAIAPFFIVGLLGGLALAIATIVKKSWSPITAPLYAALEGLVLGGISANFEVAYPGLVLQAVGLTFGTLFVLLFVYRAGIIKPTQNFRLGVVSATGAVCLVYIVDMIAGFFFHHPIGMIHQAGPAGIIFSAVVVGIAALNLVLDFDFIEQASLQRVPKYMEWYGGFGLMVTLVWLYLEMLRLLSKINRR